MATLISQKLTALILELCSLVVFLAIVSPNVGSAMTAHDLSAAMAEGNTFTIIDIRNNALYSRERIPQAINIPAAVLPYKKLPELGAVIVYGDGVDEGQAMRAVEALNKKPGIRAERLEGGLPAWEEVKGLARLEAGMGRMIVRHVSYQRLEKVMEGRSGVVLVDLRLPRKDLTDLRGGIFAGTQLLSIGRPGAKKERVSRDAGQVLSRWKKGGTSLYVLVDDGDGHAQDVAKRLQGAGVRRVVVLTGGELAIERQGQSETKIIQSRRPQ